MSPKNFYSYFSFLRHTNPFSFQVLHCRGRVFLRYIDKKYHLPMPGIVSTLCCFCRKRNAKAAGASFAYDKDDIDDVHMGKTKLDSALDTTVSLWEKAINNYREYELELLDNIETNPDCLEILSILEQVRYFPEQFIDGDIDDIVMLAKKRVEVYRYQSLLGISRGARTLISDEGKSDNDNDMNSNPLHNNNDSNNESDVSSRRMKQSFTTAPPNEKNNNDNDEDENENQQERQSRRILKQVNSLRQDPLLQRSGTTTTSTANSSSSNKHKSSNHSNSNSTVRTTLSNTLHPKNDGDDSGDGSMTSNGNGNINGSNINDDKTVASNSTSTSGSASAKAPKAGASNGILQKLSSTWAKNMDKVDMTQGGLGHISTTDGVISRSRSTSNANLHHNDSNVNSSSNSADENGKKTDNSNSHIVTIKPKWPQFLIDVWFDVIKWNNYGRKQRRIIKLTEYHILNIKNGTTISKIYWYVDVARIWLEDNNTFKIVLKDRNEPICYISPMAPSIVQQITTRIQVRLALEKTVFTATHGLDTVSSPTRNSGSNRNSLIDGNDGGTYFSDKSTAKMIEAIEAESSADTVMEDFALGLVSKMNNINGVGSNMSMSPSQKKSEKAIDRAHLFSFSEHSIEYAMQKEVQSIIFDESCDEGNTRKVFINTFDNSNGNNNNNTNETKSNNRSLRKGKETKIEKIKPKTLLDVRHFVDGLHEYYLSSRGMELTIVLLAWIKDDERKKKKEKENDNNAVSGGSSSPRVGPRGGARNASTTDNSNSNQSAAIPRGSIRGIRDENQLASLSDVHLATLSFISFIVIEEAIYLPLRESIEKLLPSFNTFKDIELYDRMKYFKSRKQVDWGIPIEFVSPLNWETATFELNGLERASTPSMQLMTLARTCKAITAEFKNCVIPELKRKGINDHFLGADNLVPIFVYVFCQTSLKTPILYKELMWNLCHPDQLHGECGYYLTIFESTIEFVEIEPINDEDFHNNSFVSRRESGTSSKSLSISGSFSSESESISSKNTPVISRKKPVMQRRQTFKEKIGWHAEPTIGMHKSFEDHHVKEDEGNEVE
jgi:hypothetical protein